MLDRAFERNSLSIQSISKLCGALVTAVALSVRRFTVSVAGGRMGITTVLRGIPSDGLSLPCRVALWGLCLVLVLAEAGCAINPVTGRTEMAVISVARERELGNQTALKVEAGMGLVADPVPLANALAVDARLAAGQMVKVALSGPYRDRRQE